MLEKGSSDKVGVQHMTDFRTKSEVELKKELAHKLEALRNFRFNVAGSKTRNMRDGRNIRKEIARILTELRILKMKGQ